MPRTPKPAAAVDKHLKARWLDAIERYREARTREAAGWDELYEALGDILDSDPPLYLAGGYKTARAFLEKEAPEQDERTVRRYVRVARHFDPDDEGRFGVTKLEALLDYLAASGGVPLPPAKIHADRQRVEVERGKVRRRVPFAEATLREIQGSTRRRRAAAGRGSDTASPFEKALRKALARAGLSSVSVRVRRDRVDLGGIPRDRLGALGRALAKADLGALRG